jgi:hypothetical protein
MSFTVPQEVVERLNTIFPRSKERVAIVLSLLGYDHNPTRAEREEIAKAVGKDTRAVELVIERLMTENLFAAEIGSVPLWKVLQKDRLDPQKNQPTSAQTSAPIPIPVTSPVSIQPPINDPELPVYPIGVSMDKEAATEVETEVETGLEAEEKGEAGSEASEDAEPKRSPMAGEPGVIVPVRSNAQTQELKAMKARQEGFEIVVKAELGGIKELLQKALEQPKQAPPAAATEVPVVSGLKGQTQQPAAETPAAEPTNPGPAAQPMNPMDPFANMSREEVIEFFQRSDAEAFRPNGATDPRFAGALKEAVFKGVEVYAYDSAISLGAIKFNRRVPVDLDDNPRLT